MKDIAIIGSGISGLTCAYLLDRKHNVTVFEKNDYIGGHTATKDIVFNNKSYAIDTGFIVCNNRTYPNFLKLLKLLKVDLQPTEMSFSVLNKQTNLEYNGNTLNSLFAQRSNILSLKFWGLVKDIIKFNKHCKAAYASDNINKEDTLGDFLKLNNFSDYFKQNYILPMGAAIWSTSLSEMEEFPLHFFIRFFYNHGLLNITTRPQWYVIPGGSREYIEPLTASFADKIELNSHIKHVIRHINQVEIVFENGTTRLFDDVVFACHSDQALALLKDPSANEIDILGSIPYTSNEVVLHTDTNLLPKRKLAWASWNYLLDNTSTDAQLTNPSCVTYNMNILQGLKDTDTTFCVTLNQTEKIDPSKIISSYIYHHPVFNHQSLQAQYRRKEICGQNNTHFAGAYWRNGFHEDGVFSALVVAKRFGIGL
ncbi:NAD(P)/FAD-dependent oxidoreductase [Pseudocolwellia agarivorans]|uniref:NAD(P)/FAD-dependent oxidoreductase n=1 Tax=Pseudocolwellia agarivorans TaxID=1911682 RepID=UPI003F883C27